MNKINKPFKSDSNSNPAILTNMSFWQSAYWLKHSESIYNMSSSGCDPVMYSPLKEACLLWKHRSRYDVILTMGARESLLYGLLCLLTATDSRQVMTEVFIDKSKANFAWKMKNALYSLVSKRSIGILTNSKDEIKTMAHRYRLSERKLLYVAMHSNIAEPHAPPTRNGRVLSAGRTLRDIDTLLTAAHKINGPVDLICGQNETFHTSVPDNVTIYREIPRSDYLTKLQECSVVALPLLDTERSTGQVVMLEAMAYGKPVVTTCSPGTKDYIRDQETGYLIDVNDSTALAIRINELLASEEMQNRIGTAACQSITKNFTFETHAKAKIAAIKQLWLHAISENSTGLNSCDKCNS